MKKLIGVIVGAVMIVGMSVMNIVTSPRVFAASCEVKTSVLGDNGCVNGAEDGSAIFSVLNIVLQILTYGVGIVGTFGIVITGIQYMTAKDNAGQLAAAKTRMIAIIIGLVAYAVLWAFLQWLLPGGLFSGR